MAKRPHFIKEWRKFKGLTQEQLAGRLEEEPGRPIATASLSRIERGIQPYNQGTLEAIANALGVSPAELLGRDPRDTPPEELFRVIEGLSPKSRKQLLEIARTFLEQIRAA